MDEPIPITTGAEVGAVRGDDDAHRPEGAGRRDQPSGHEEQAADAETLVDPDDDSGCWVPV